MLLDRNSIGVDITATSLNLIWLQSEIRCCTLMGHATFPLQPEGEAAGAERIREIAARINAFIEENTIPAPEVHLAIPAEQSITRTIRFPFTVKENFRETLRFELEKYVPFPESQIVYDCQIIAEDTKNKVLTILLVAVKKDDLEPYLQLCRELRTGISGIEISATARANALSLQKELSGPLTLFAAPGLETMEIILLHQGRLLATRSIPCAPAKTLIERLSPEMKLCQTYDLTPTHKLKLIAGKEELLAAAAGDSAPMEVTLWQPGETAPSVELLCAYGLAARGLRRMAHRVNLLPAAMRKKPDRRGVYLLLGLLLLNAILLVTWSGSLMMQRRMIAERLEGEISRLTKATTEYERIVAEVDKTERKIDFLNTFQHDRPFLVDVLTELSHVLPESAWIQNFRLSGNSIQIDGLAESASELIVLLEQSPFFKDVAFQSAISKNPAGREQFKIELFLE
ncbi:MAG: PilN domain-containing protein [Thermodesulfobacteriota bacterium]